MTLEKMELNLNELTQEEIESIEHIPDELKGLLITRRNMMDAIDDEIMYGMGYEGDGNENTDVNKLDTVYNSEKNNSDVYTMMNVSNAISSVNELYETTKKIVDEIKQVSKNTPQKEIDLDVAIELQKHIADLYNEGNIIFTKIEMLSSLFIDPETNNEKDFSMDDFTKLNKKIMTDKKTFDKTISNKITQHMNSTPDMIELQNNINEIDKLINAFVEKYKKEKEDFVKSYNGDNDGTKIKNENGIFSANVEF